MRINFALIILFTASSAGSYAQSQQKTPTPSSRWQLTKQVDKMSDSEELTLLLRSVEGLASLRIHCNSKGSYVAFLTFPKAIQLTDPTLAEVRFDKREPVFYIMTHIEYDILIAAVGGSKTEANYAFATTDPAKGVRGGFTADDVANSGLTLVKDIRASTRMVYRLSLARAAHGTEGTFNLAGFERAFAPLIKRCPIE